MKKLFYFIAILFSSVSIAQSAQNESDLSHRFKEQSNYSEKTAAEPEIDTLLFDFQVTDISGTKAKIISSELGKKYEVPVSPQLNPFGYVLQVDREYTIYLERDMNQVREYQTRGQTRTLPARMIWFTVSDKQLKKDQARLKDFIDSQTGYDRSPRNGH